MLPNFKIALRPNNQVTITRQFVIAKNERFESVNSTLSIDNHVVDNYVRRRVSQEGLGSFYSKGLRHDCLDVPASNILPLPPLPLGLINRFQRDKKQPIRKKRGYGTSPQIKYFSGKAGQKVRETGAIIDRLCGESTEKCRVVTLTLPSSDVEAFKALSDFSGYATNRLFQVIRRDYPDSFYFYVWEHQKRGALHMHIAIYNENPEISKEIGEKLCLKWFDILRDVSRMAGVNLLFSKGFNRECKTHEVNTDNQAMRLSCGAYFAKYASKTSGKNSADINSVNARKYPPCSFWGRSRELARMCEAESFKFSFAGVMDGTADEMEVEAMELLSASKIVLSHSFAFKKEIELGEDYGGGTLTICEGFTRVFYVSPDEYKKLLIHFRFLYKDRRTCNVTERSKVSMVRHSMFDDAPLAGEEI